MTIITTSVQPSIGEVGQYHKMGKKMKYKYLEKKTTKVSSFTSAMIIHRKAQPSKHKVTRTYKQIHQDCHK